MSWEIFDRAAAGYEAWYATRRGRRADAAERRMLLHLLGHFQSPRDAIEVGCGTGHFTAFLAQRLNAIGVERAPAMLAEARRSFSSMPLVVADAHRLPFRDESIDLAVFVTTLEFLDDPVLALAEAVRIARRGVIGIVLNRLSLGGLSRRYGPQSRGALLSNAHDYSSAELRRSFEQAAGARFDRTWSASTLFPNGLSLTLSSIPLGDVLGCAVKLKRSVSNGPTSRDTGVTRGSSGTNAT